MTDRELLELAAKAAGIAGEYRSGLGICPPELSQLHKFWWNPLTDDGDALRLVVKLRMNVVIREKYVPSVGCAELDEDVLGGCIYAAARRAIVRAAAAVGKDMP